MPRPVGGELHSKVVYVGSMVSDHLKGAWTPLILLWLGFLSASMRFQEKILVKNIEEGLASLAVVAASE